MPIFPKMSSAESSHWPETANAKDMCSMKPLILSMAVAFLPHHVFATELAPELKEVVSCMTQVLEAASPPPQDIRTSQIKTTYGDRLLFEYSFTNNQNQRQSTQLFVTTRPDATGFYAYPINFDYRFGGPLTLAVDAELARQCKVKSFLYIP